MKTPRYQLTVRAVAAAAIALAGSFYAVPALAEAGGTEPAPAASPTAPTSSATTGTVTPNRATSGAVTPNRATSGAMTPSPATSVGAAPAVAPKISDAGLAEAVRRDLGMTLEEFNAAGQLARTAADAVPSLRGLPGYVGISLEDGRIHVEGSGAVLQTQVDKLNEPGTAEVFVLVAPAVAPSPDPSASPSAAPSTTPATPSTTPSVTPSADPSAAPADVPSAAELVASNTDQLFQAYVREVGPAGLQAVAYSGGSFIVRTGGTNAAEVGAQIPDQQTAPATTPAAPGKVSPADFVARYANVQLEQGPPATTEADVYGGEGYAVDRQTICSTGFGAFSAAGLPVVLTAGHCAEDGKARIAELEPPTSATAGGSAPRPGTLAPLGSFGFSQFGGPLNSWISGTEEAPGNVGTDIAVIEGINAGLDLQAAVTTWADAANPGATAVKIIGTVAPFQGQEVCRSGRTAGWSCGQVEETGIYVVGGRTTAASDLRAFRGFLSRNVQSSGGDSGGPWISGNFAVGTHSAGETVGPNFAVATTLEDALTKFPTAVQLQLFLNKPEIVDPDDLTFVAGQPITGRVPAAPASAVAANSKVRITVDKQTVEVPVDAAGNWAYPAPDTTGTLKLTAETVNGFSRSGAAALAVKVTNLDAPVITTPAEGAALESVTSIDGTGTPGLTVKLTGDISGSAVVAPDGRWSITVEETAPGSYSFSAVQTSPGEVDSSSAARNFTIAAPVVVPTEPATPTPTIAPAVPEVPATQPLAPVVPAALTPVLPAGSGQLPDTGAGSLLPTAGLAGGALLLGGILLAAARRRTVG